MASEATIRLLDAERSRVEKLAMKVQDDDPLAFEALDECAAILRDATERVQQREEPMWESDIEAEEMVL